MHNARVQVFENQMSLSLKKCLKLEHQLGVTLSLSKHTGGANLSGDWKNFSKNTTGLFPLGKKYVFFYYFLVAKNHKKIVDEISFPKITSMK